MAANLVLMGMIVILSCGFIQSEFLNNAGKLTCMPGVPRFSSKKSPTHFYQCNEEETPSLMECPTGELYHTKTQECLAKSETRNEEPITIEALGRNFQLGSMYNGRRNKFYPEASFWSPQKIRDSEIISTENGSPQFDVSTEKTVKNKMDHMNIQASLTMDFMSGMVSVSGSGGFLRDTSERDDEVNIGLSYREITHTKRLTEDVEKNYAFECTNPEYTHVVTEVSYGLGANFEFRRVIHEDESTQDINGQLKVTINNIPGFSISGEGSVDLSDYEQNLLNTTSLKMYGDFSPNGDYLIPTTFDEAIGFYSLLPVMTGNEASNFNGTTIISATLLPVTWVCTDAEYVLEEINEGTMKTMINMLNDMDLMSMKVGGLLTRNAAQKYIPIRRNLNMFKVQFESYKLNVKRKLQEILPNIRAGTGFGEEDLNLLYSEYIASPFNINNASIFLSNRNREIESIESLTDQFPMESNIAVVDYESANDVRYIYSFKNNLILELNILTPSLYVESFLNGTMLSEDNFWYNDMDTLGDIARLLNDFRLFALDNVDREDYGYLVNLLPVIGEIGEVDPWKVKALVTGDLITEHFIVPGSSKIDGYHELTHDGFKFWVKKSSEFVTGCKVHIQDLASGEIMEEVRIIQEDTPVDSDVEIVVDSLIANHIYSFTAKLMTQVGTSPPSKESSQLITAPASPPERFSAKEVTSSSVTLAWGPPLVIAEGLTEQDFQYNIVQTDEDGVDVHETTKSFEKTFTNLNDAANYSYEIRAVTINGNGESPASRTSLFSSPLPPVIKDTYQVSSHMATIYWDPPAKLPSGSTILQYILSYSPVGGSEEDEQQITVEGNQCDVTNLAQGQQYQFKTKILTSEGSSDFSAVLLLTTSYIHSELDKMKDDIRDNVIVPMLNDVQKEQSKQLSVCAYQDNLGLSEQDQVVPFKETYLEKNDFSSGDLFGHGFFIPPVAGTYQLSYKVGQAKLDPGNGVHIFKLFKNSDTLKESWSLAKLENANAFVPISGTIMLELFQGDMVMLVHESQNDPQETAHITLCIQLLQKE